MGDLRQHFSRWEFVCPHCRTLEGPDDHLLDCLQRLRIAVGRPLVIVSGFRCRTYNARVGGIRTSQHLYGRAADIPGGYASLRQVRAAGFHGVGIRKGRVVHVDVTPGRSFFTFPDP